MTISDLRADIPALEEVTYLNTGASGPSPRSVVDAAEQFLEYHEFDAPGKEGMYTAAFVAFDEARDAVANLLNAQPGEIALTQSTTDGINRIACALEWERGDTIVRTDLEHPAGILPWERLKRTRGIDVHVVTSERGRIDMDAYHAAVENAALVCVSSITWKFGSRLPIPELVEIAHDAGAYVLVDAVQTCGQTGLDVEEWGADIVASAGHKWLLGLWGAGFLYVSADIADQFDPRFIGYRGVEIPTDQPYRLKPGAERFEVGTTNPAPYCGLETSIGMFTDIGLGRIESRIQQLTRYLTDQLPADRVLSPLPPESGLVTIEVPNPESTVDRLGQAGVIIRSLPDPSAIRVSVHAINTHDEIGRLCVELVGEW